MSDVKVSGRVSKLLAELKGLSDSEVQELESILGGSGSSPSCTVVALDGNAVSFEFSEGFPVVKGGGGRWFLVSPTGQKVGAAKKYVKGQAIVSPLVRSVSVAPSLLDGFPVGGEAVR